MFVAFEAVHRVVYQDDDARFDPKMPDAEWLAILAADDLPWAVVTHDYHILRRESERRALTAAGMKFFDVVGKPWSRLTLHEQAWRFVRAWPDVVREATTTRHRVFEVRAPNMKIEAVAF